jgi:hypothetical protein
MIKRILAVAGILAIVAMLTASTTINGDRTVHDLNITGTCTGCGSGVTTNSPLSGTTSLSCTTCVVASSPGVGLAHFAGSTQTVTSSAVNLAGADVTGTLGNGNYFGTLKTSYVTTSESTSSPSTAYAQLATADTITFTLAATTTVTVLFTSQCSSNTVSTGIFSQFTVDAVDNSASAQEFDATTINFLYGCTASYSASLGSGSHTILMKYKATGTSVLTFAHRTMVAYATP